MRKPRLDQTDVSVVTQLLRSTGKSQPGVAHSSIRSLNWRASLWLAPSPRDVRVQGPLVRAPGASSKLQNIRRGQASGSPVPFPDVFVPRAASPSPDEASNPPQPRLPSFLLPRHISGLSSCQVAVCLCKLSSSLRLPLGLPAS